MSSQWENNITPGKRDACPWFKRHFFLIIFIYVYMSEGQNMLDPLDLQSQQSWVTRQKYYELNLGPLQEQHML